MSLRRKSAKGIFWTLSEQFGLGGISFLIDLYLTRLLSPSDFGLIGMILFFAMVGQTLMEGGMITSLIRMKDPGSADYSTVFLTNVIVSVIVYGVLYLAAPLIASFYHQPALIPVSRWYLLGLVISAFSVVHQARLRKELNFKTHAKIQFAAKITSGLCGVGFAYLGQGVWSLVYMFVIHQALIAVQLWVLSAWRPMLTFDRRRLRHHLHFGYKLTISALLETAASNAYYLIVGRFFSPLMVGYYLRANQLRLVPVAAVSTALTHVTLPLFASLQDDPQKLRMVYKRIMQQVLFCVMPLLLVVAVLGEPLFELVFTAKWLPAVPYFQILCLAGILYPFHSYNLNILKAMGRSDLFLKLEIIKKLLLVAIIVVGIQFGIFGLLVGQVVMSAVSFFINSYYSGKFIDYGAVRQVKDSVPIILLSLATALVVYGVDRYLLESLGLLVRGLGGLAVGFIFYFASAILFRLEAYGDFLIFVREVRDQTDHRDGERT